MNFIAGMMEMGGFPPVFIVILKLKFNKQPTINMIVYRYLSGIMFANHYVISAEILVP